jgi:hypothetical protein
MSHPHGHGVAAYRVKHFGYIFMKGNIQEKDNEQQSIKSISYGYFKHTFDDNQTHD